MAGTKAGTVSGIDTGRKADEVVRACAQKMQEFKEALMKGLPDLSEGTRKALYTTSYYVAFGALSVTGCLTSIFSKEGPVVSGFREGMAAAKKTEPHSAPQAPKAAPRKAPSARRASRPKEKKTTPTE
jgi:hypothetical protein